MKTTPLGLLIPDVGDPPAGPEQIGGNAERTDALLRAGGNAAHVRLEAEVTRAGITRGPFSTPIKCTLPYIPAYATVGLLLWTWANSATTTESHQVAISIVGKASFTVATGINAAEDRWQNIVTNNNGLALAGSTAPISDAVFPTLPSGFKQRAGDSQVGSSFFLFQWLGEDLANAVVELTGRKSEYGGRDLAVRSTYLEARVFA